MNKKVLKVMICLVVVFLIALYVIKIFFPQQFVMVIQNEVFIKIGNFIDQRMWLSKICSGITTFIGIGLYLCAVSRKWFLPKKELIIFIAIIIGTRFLYLYDANLANGVMTASMLLIPCMLNANLKDVAIVFSVHELSQYLAIKIRNLPYLLSNINSIISIFLTIEGIFWLLLFYFYLNYKKEVIK